MLIPEKWGTLDQRGKGGTWSSNRTDLGFMEVSREGKVNGSPPKHLNVESTQRQQGEVGLPDGLPREEVGLWAVGEGAAPALLLPLQLCMTSSGKT